MYTTATERYGMPLAPGGLALVQDLLNTAARGRPRQADLLESPTTAFTWSDMAIDLWASRSGHENRPARPRASLDEADLARLRAIREELKAVMGRGDMPHEQRNGSGLLRGEVVLQLGPTGELRAEPQGEGVDRLAAAILHEIHLAQLTDTWRRLKLCRNGACSGAFFDRSRNNSGVWHDVRICGNAINLRASRARRRVREGRAATA